MKICLHDYGCFVLMNWDHFHFSFVNQLYIIFWQNHWSTYIVEDDFKFISASGLTAVRIPVGWWIASDPNPPAPYVGGSLQTLDNAFKWAE